MKRGEKCEITLSPEYAYGQAGSPPKIGPNETLIFEIELFDWQLQDVSPDLDKTIQMQVLQPGEGYDRPRVGTVLVNLTGRIDSSVGPEFDRRDNLNFKLGEGSEQSVISGIECALRKMKKGETARVFIKSPVHAFGKHCLLPEGAQLPEHYEQLVYDVELVNFENEKETWEMNAQERLQQAELTKEKGTTYFKQGKFESALRQYQKIIQYVGPPENQEFGDQAEERDKHLLSGYLNLAICYLKLDQPDEVLKNADLALNLDPKNPKALFRRGLAHYSVKEYEKAIQDFNQCLEIEPTNKAVKNQIVMCKHQLKQHAEMEKKIYRNLFEVLGKEDDWF